VAAKDYVADDVVGHVDVAMTQMLFQSADMAGGVVLMWQVTW
jgi:hypothetical protein